MSKMKDCVKVKGFVRFQRVDAKTGKVLGEPTPWMKNQVVNGGFQDFICGSIGNVGASKQISYMGIGTGTVPGAAATTLDGETGSRAVTSNSVISSKTLQMTCQFSGTAMGSTCTIQNVGLFNSSSGGALCAGITYATSQWASNQNVNATLIKDGVEAVVTLLEKLREFGGQLKNILESIPSRASEFVKNFVEGVTTRYEAPAFAG
jgi:hypothetical protein